MVYDSHGQPSHFQSIARDITERVKTQEQLSLQATALEAAANGILITDAQGVILWHNPAVTGLTGYQAEEVIGETPRIFKSGVQSEAFYKELWDTILSGRVWHGELSNRRKDGDLYTAEMTITPVRNAQGEIVRFIGIMQDISERIRSRQMLEELATQDPLTRLPNRALFSDRLDHALTHAKRTGCKAAVLFVDLDDFKSVNDSFGHELGDLLLQSVAQRLLDCVRESDTAARLGGDEFTILLENLVDQAGAVLVARNVLAALSAPFSLKGRSVSISSSIGISIYPDDSQDAEVLLKFADQAMYIVKQAGKQGYHLFGSSA
jgi:diguanylate cyclase (GGDEF)-like protein/PAS domain S-box-containing protein